jgi:hypothetical protein
MELHEKLAQARVAHVEATDRTWQCKLALGKAQAEEREAARLVRRCEHKLNAHENVEEQKRIHAAARAAKAAAAEKARQELEQELDRQAEQAYRDRQVELERRARDRFVICRADADAGGSGFPAAAARLDPDEWAILRDLSIPRDTVATRIGLFPFHVDKLRRTPVPVAKQASTNTKITDEQVRELRTTKEPLELVALRMGIAASYAKLVRYRGARAAVPDVVPTKPPTVVSSPTCEAPTS